MAHLGEYGFGGNAAVHHKDAPGLTVLRLDLGQEDAQRRVVGRVAGEHLVGERQAFRRHHQGDDDLDAVGALIAAIAEAALVGLILRRIGFEIGAGQIVKQHIEAGVEEIAPAIDKMAEQGLLVGEEKVMAGIELVGLGEAEVTAEQIGQRALAEPLAMQEPLAAGRNQPVGDQHEQDLLPTRALAAGRQARGEEAVELQLLPQLQGEPAGAPLTRSAKLEAREAQADDGLIGGRRLAAILGEQRDCLRLGRAGLVKDLDRPAPGEFLRGIDLAEIEHRPLDDPAVAQPLVLDNAPVAVLLAVLPANCRAQKHDGAIQYIEDRSRK